MPCRTRQHCFAVNAAQRSQPPTATRPRQQGGASRKGSRRWQAAHALRRAGAARITALLPYLAYARQDRAGHTESLGLAWVGELLRATGISEVITVDVHRADAGPLLGLELTSLSPARLLADALPVRWRDGVTFVAPDEGAVDRCAALAQAAEVDRPIVWTRKRRTPAFVESLGLVGSPGSREVVVDDILDTGGTLVFCCRQLRSAGVREIAVIVTHGLFTGERWRALISEGVEQIWITLAAAPTTGAGGAPSPDCSRRCSKAGGATPIVRRQPSSR